MSAIKIGYINILETSTVTLVGASEDPDYPLYRLYDRNIGRLAKTDTTDNQDIKVQQLGGNQVVNTLFIPAGHNLDGVTMNLRYSDDGITYFYASSQWSQSGEGQILKEFAAQTREYWMTNCSAFSNPPEASEYYLTFLYSFVCAPLYGLSDGDHHNVSRNETKSGIAHFLSHGESRRQMSYKLNNISSAEKTEMESWNNEWAGYKPFLFVDHNANVFFAELASPIKFQQFYNYFTAEISIQEVLG